MKANLLVEAGAGTGKTESLVYTFLEYAFKHEHPIDRILALTFTEKAANEMRSRLSDALAELARGNLETLSKLNIRAGVGLSLEDAQSRARAALTGIERAIVTTIHSFCAHVLRLFPIEAGVPPAFEIDEGTVFDEEFERAWGRWLDSELSNSSSRESWMEILRAIPLSTLHDLARELCNRTTLPLPIPMRPPSDPTETLKRIDTLLSRAEGPNNDTLRSLRVARMVLSGQAGLDHARLIVDKEPTQKKYGDVKKEIVHVLRIAKTYPGTHVLIPVLSALTPFAQKFRDDLIRRGTLTFDGLVALTRRLLISHPDVRRHLKKSFSAILVDEFQDTDPIQYEIALFLAEKADTFTPHFKDVALEPGKLYIVGDPKQSIYAFRGADLHAYREVAHVVRKNGGETVHLEKNYRSRPGIIHAVNEIFAQVLKGMYQPLTATRFESTPDEVEIVRLPAEIRAGEARELEAECIADWIASHTRPGERGKVAILLRTFSEVLLYLDALRRRRLPYVIEGERYFYRAQEVIDVVNLLACVINPHDRVAFVGFLRSLYAGLSDVELFRLRDRLDYLAFDHPMFLRLRRLHERIKRARIEDVIGAAFEEFHILETTSATHNGPQAVANLLKLRRQAVGCSVREFVETARRSVEEFRDEGESPIADENLDAVKVLTIHRSKGLEFEICIVPDLHRKIRDTVSHRILVDWSTRRVGVSLGPGLEDIEGCELRELLEERRRSEARRVLYVAMTRAKSKLLLTGQFKVSKTRASNPQTLLDEPQSLSDLLIGAAPAVLGEPGVISIGQAAIRVRDYEHQATTIRSEGPAAIRLDAAPYLEAWTKRQEAFQRIVGAPIVRTPSGMEEHEKRNVPSELERAVARQVGVLCHQALEGWNYRGTREELQARVSDPEAARILGDYWGSDAYLRIARSKILGSEVPFAMRDGEATVSGVIDLVCELDDRLYVVDYKTDAALQPERYWPQLDCYVRAVGSGTPVLVGLRTGTWVQRP